MVPIAAFGIAYSVYENNEYETLIAEIEYHYGGRPGAMWGYDYRLVPKVKFPSIIKTD